MANDYGDQAKYKSEPYYIDSEKKITALGMRKALGTKEDVANKQDTITDNSTYYPSAKAVYAHTSNKNNPHGVTAAQAGARPSTWTPTKADVGLGNVNNTSDADKPVSTLTQAALNAKQNTLAAASDKAAGLMSKDDKIKLDSIATSANNYAHPTATAYTSGLYKVTVNGLGHVTAATAATKADITALGIPGSDTNTTYSAATSDAAGLMSKDDKIKLDGINTALADKQDASGRVSTFTDNVSDDT
ncbi:hypothetical protein NO2_1009, partial [Candidatus Termititenax persephonae]